MVSESSKKHFEAISNEVNDTCFRPSEVGHLLANDHRYLQNEFAKAAMAFLFELGENYEKNRYDARNVRMAMVAHEIVSQAREGLHITTDCNGNKQHNWSSALSGEYYCYLQDKARREREGE